ncbi:MAG: hypothetical protein KC910_17345 [Candidatus Eremiobacteraeota bacterium]|nr:hypothetical protein [Candidatus Eremiobacteraeota bacterium]
MKKLILLLVLMLAGSAWAIDVEFPYPDEGMVFFEAQAAALDTPVSFPPNAVYRKYDRAKAQQAVKNAFPPNSEKVQKVTLTHKSGPVTYEQVLRKLQPELVDR